MSRSRTEPKSIHIEETVMEVYYHPVHSVRALSVVIGHKIYHFFLSEFSGIARQSDVSRRVSKRATSPSGIYHHAYNQGKMITGRGAPIGLPCLALSLCSVVETDGQTQFLHLRQPTRDHFAPFHQSQTHFLPDRA